MTDLIFDTETTGFVHSKSPLDDPRQPHLVQLAAILADRDHIISSFCVIVKCSIEIPEGAVAVHGITKELSQKEGVSVAEALYKFGELFRQASRLVAHNMTFDYLVMRIAYLRQGYHWRSNIPLVCTMKSSVDPGGLRDRKWPKLQEAYKALVDPAGFAGAHNAEADTKACFEILRALEAKGLS